MIFFVLNYFLIIFYFLDVLILKINFKNKKYIFLNKKIKKITITANLKHGKDRYPNWFWNSGQECIGRYSQRMLRLSAFFLKNILHRALRSDTLKMHDLKGWSWLKATRKFSMDELNVLWRFTPIYFYV